MFKRGLPIKPWIQNSQRKIHKCEAQHWTSWDIGFLYIFPYDDMDLLEGYFVPEYQKEIFHNPMEPMEPLDSPPSDPPAMKIPLWLCNTLQDLERHVRAKETFRERNTPW